MQEAKDIELRKTFSFWFLGLIVAFSAITVFCSLDFWVLGEAFGRGIPYIHSFFYNRNTYSLTFTPYELIIILLNIAIIYKFRGNFKFSGRVPIFFFLSSVITVFLIIINPNAPYDSVGLYAPVPFYLYLMLLSTLLFLKEDTFFALVEKLFKIIAAILVIRLTIMLGLFFAGKGMELGIEKESCLSESDTLGLCSFFQTMFLALFFAFKSRRSLLGWFLLSAVLFFSARRSHVVVAFFSNSLLFLLYFIKLSLGKKIAIIYVIICICVCALLAFVYFPEYVFSDSINFYIERYAPILYIFLENPNKSEDNSASLHRKESSISMEYAMAKRPFWGVGLRQEFDIIPEISDLYSEYGVHNVYVVYWLRYGLFMLIYYISFLLFSIYEIFRLLFSSKRNELSYSMIKGAVLLYMIGVCVVDWVAWSGWFDHLKYMAIFAFIIVFIIKFKSDNYKLLFSTL